MGQAGSHDATDGVADGWSAHATRLSAKTLEQARQSGRLYLVRADLVEFPLEQLVAAELSGMREPYVHCAADSLPISRETVAHRMLLHTGAHMHTKQARDGSAGEAAREAADVP